MMDRILRRRSEVLAAMESCGVAEADLYPDPKGEPEVFVHAPDAQALCDTIQIESWHQWQPGVIEVFQTFTRRRDVYERQYFEPWDEKVPCYILGVDFEMGMDKWRRPKNPALWCHVHHYADNHSNDWRIISATILEPTENGAALLNELQTRFENWFPGGIGRPPLDAVLDYRAVLNKYGVDCNEAFRYDLAEAWYPIDIQYDKDRENMRRLVATPFPDDLGELIVEANGDPVPRYRIFFKFVALTDNWS